MTSKIVDFIALQGLRTRQEQDTAVAALREELESVAEEFPHLVDPTATGPANVAFWEETVRSETKPVSFRLSPGLMNRVDGYASEVQGRAGVKVSRTDAVRVLLELSLDLVDLVETDDRLTPDPAVIRELTKMAMEAVQRVREPVA